MGTTIDNSTPPGSARNFDYRQWVKLTVYALLLLNFAFYIVDDWQIASHTLRNGGSFLDWTAAFAVSIDELAWFVLLFLFELETYALPDEAFTRLRTALLHGIRLVCYIFLAHTVIAYLGAASDLIDAEEMSGINQLCQLVDEDISYGSNLSYTELDSDNCASLSTDSTFYLIENGAVVTDTRGLAIEHQLVWIDLVEAIVWLLILFCIELLVRLQERGIVAGATVRLLSSSKLALYALLWGFAAYWVYRGHYMYAWDEALWILGFAAIEMNMSDWKKEIIAAENTGD